VGGAIQRGQRTWVGASDGCEDHRIGEGRAEGHHHGEDMQREDDVIERESREHGA
jgi:hypothetical protein